MVTSSLGYLISSYRPKVYAEDADFIPEAQKDGDAGADLKADLRMCKLTLSEAVELVEQENFTGAVFINGKKLDTEERKHLPDTKAAMLLPGESLLVGCGFHIQLPRLPEPWAAVYKIVGRSGLAGGKRLCISNSPGIIDAGYTGLVMMAVENRSDSCHIFTHKARIAQGLYEVVVDQGKVGFDRVSSVSDFVETSRGAGGFGSTHS